MVIIFFLDLNRINSHSHANSGRVLERATERRGVTVNLIKRAISHCMHCNSVQRACSFACLACLPPSYTKAHGDNCVVCAVDC